MLVYAMHHLSKYVRNTSCLVSEEDNISVNCCLLQTVERTVESVLLSDWNLETNSFDVGEPNVKGFLEVPVISVE
jgi:hypothetical protein